MKTWRQLDAIARRRNIELYRPDIGVLVLFLVAGQERGRVEWRFVGDPMTDRILRAMVEAALEVSKP